MTESTELPSFAELLADARQLSEAGRRRILGITGPPGAGKSTLAQRLVIALGSDRAVLVGMDGFHICDAELRRTGLRDRKGAPETFDRAGYAALLHRLRREAGTVYAPAFDRALEDSIAAAVAVPAAVPLVVTEGNYLLLWPEIRSLLDEVWFLDPLPTARRDALIARHVAFGKTLTEAESWVLTSDERNAEAVASGRHRADRVLGWTAD
jgi:pantothenate kinase